MSSMNCHKGKYSCNAFESIYCELEAERDRLHDHLQKMQITNGSLTDEVDRLKVEPEEKTKALDQNDIAWARNHALIADRDLWKSKAEKLAEALRHCAKYSPEIYDDENGLEHSKECPACVAKEAIAEYEKVV